MAIDEGYLQQQRDIAKVVVCLVEGGHTLNGELISFWDLAQRTGIEKKRLYHALCYLLDGRHGKSFIEEYEGGTLHSEHALERVIGREPEPRPWEVFVRLTEDGIRLAREEIAVRHQLKQLADFDVSSKRSRRSFSMSVAALTISGLMLIAAGLRVWTLMGSGPREPHTECAPGSQALPRPDSSTLPGSVWAICGPCDTTTTNH